MTEVQNSPDQLSDPGRAARAWRHYRRIMRWVVVSAMLSVAGALLYLMADGSPLTTAMVIATSAGVALSVLLAGALMGLIFLSSGTGHDEDVQRFGEVREDGGDDSQSGYR